MDRILRITSLQNGRVKHIVRLNQRRYRDQHRMTIVEGVRECRRALQSGLIPLEAYVCPPLLTEPETSEVLTTLQTLNQAGKTKLFEVTPEVFAKIAYRGASGGILLLIPYLEKSLADVPITAVPFIVILEQVEKPGNLGAILRTADAAGVDAVILTGSGTDIHNPNVIRASLGTLFTVPVIMATNNHTRTWLHQHHIPIIATTPAATTCYTDIPLNGPVAILMGSEAHGLSPEWLSIADYQVKIPMYGTVDSLNLSVSTAILLYEVIRQRKEPVCESP
ncbi:MAG: RNA methyltransferase [Chloroflexi bacterium]|nr:MAG: RNA methyltransferase [Chloroflexota bacterium]